MTVTEESEKKKYLIIARVGDSSLHRLWLEPKEFRSFDLCLSYYGNQPGRYVTDCKYYSEARGGKWQQIKKIAENFGKDIEHYQAIWIPDEHINTNAFNIDQMFHIFSDQKLRLAQPAFSDDSHTPSPALLRNPEFIYRYVRFDKMTAPIFFPEALTACVTTMNVQSSGKGSEFIWPKELPYPINQTAVIDETPVKRTKPEGQVLADPAKENAPTSHPKASPLLIRKSGRSSRPRKKANLKRKFIKKQMLKKTTKTKLVHKPKKSLPIPKPFIKQKKRSSA